MYRLNECCSSTVLLLLVLFLTEVLVSKGENQLKETSIIVQMPTSEVVLSCHVNDMDAKIKYNIRWEIGERGLLVLEKNSFGQLHVGQNYRDIARLGTGCSLILRNFTVEHSGEYIVMVDDPNSPAYRFVTEKVQLIIVKESAVVIRPTTASKTTPDPTADSWDLADQRVVSVFIAFIVTVVATCTLTACLGLLLIRVFRWKRTRRAQVPQHDDVML